MHLLAMLAHRWNQVEQAWQRRSPETLLPDQDQALRHTVNMSGEGDHFGSGVPTGEASAVSSVRTTYEE